MNACRDSGILLPLDTLLEHYVTNAVWYNLKFRCAQ